MMKHYYVTGPERIEVVDEPIPRPGEHEVIVRLAYTALSPGSNVYVYRTGSYTGQWDGGREEAVYMDSGHVASAGAAVTTLAPGDPVVMNGTGHQAYACLPVEKVHRLPAGLDLRAASLAYLAGWAVSALHLGQYAAAETVVVIGQGLVGASAALMADQMGARVLALDTAPERVAVARRFGLGAVEQPGTAGAAARIAAFLGETGADLILETSGAWPGFRQAVELARDYTRIAIMGIYRQPPPADIGAELHQALYAFPSKFHYQRLHIIGCGYDPETVVAPNRSLATREGNFAYTLEQAARGKLRLDRLITDVVPANQIATVLARFTAGDKAMVGVVFDWTADEAASPD